jgi:polysaccharide lyase-like protein
VRIALAATVGLLLAIALGACSGSTTEFFGGNFEDGGFAEWDHTQAIPGRIAIVDDDVVEGDRAARFEVRGGDEEPGTGAQRAEVVSGVEFDEGDVRYFRILARIESWDDDDWGMIWQLHDQSSGSPPLSLQREADGSERILWIGSGDGSELYWAQELPEADEWFEVVIRVEFGESGSLEVWLNGERQEMANDETVYEGIDTLGEGPGYDKLGIYRSSSAEDTAVVYYDDYRVTDDFFSDPPG